MAQTANTRLLIARLSTVAIAAVLFLSYSKVTHTEPSSEDYLKQIEQLRKEAKELQEAGDLTGAIAKFRVLAATQEKLDSTGPHHHWTRLMLSFMILQNGAAGKPDPEGLAMLEASCSAIQDMSNELLMAGKPDDAMELLQKLAGIQNQILGQNNPSLQQTLATIAAVLAVKGDLQSAREVYESVFANQIETLKADDMNTKVSHTNAATYM